MSIIRLVILPAAHTSWKISYIFYCYRFGTIWYYNAALVLQLHGTVIGMEHDCIRVQSYT
jgi:hypothetical protein